MEIFRTVSSLNSHLKKFRESGDSIGFVPTMGALHQGHLALVEQASRENNHVVLSIFVNPTQFNNQDDLKRYPRNTDDDIAKLQTSSCDILFLPEVEEMYPSKVESEAIDLGGLDQTMEGAHRPGHFNGVATVVGRFFDIVRPTRAYFGEKDFQQLMVIRHISRLKDFPIEIVAHPIERNDKGLALSSRNQLLSAGDQEKALAIHHNLQWAATHYRQLSPAELRSAIEQNFEKEPLDLEYVEVVDEENLRSIDTWKQAKNARVFIAAHISGVRLIDNVSLF